MVQAVYADVDQSLSRNFVYESDSVFQSIKNILMTRKGTKMFNKEFGSNLDKLLFELDDPSVELMAYAEVIEAISTWEPRAILDRGLTKVSRDPDNHILWVELVFTLKGIEGVYYNYEIGFKK